MAFRALPNDVRKPARAAGVVGLSSSGTGRYDIPLPWEGRVQANVPHR